MPLTVIHPTLSAANRSVALVEDSRILRAVLRGLVQQVNGLAISAEYSGYSDALAGLREQPVDLVLLDVQLADGSGMDVLHFLKKASPSTVIMIVTNHAEEVYRQCFLAAGAHRFYDKSFDLDILRNDLTVFAGGTP